MKITANTPLSHNLTPLNTSKHDKMSLPEIQSPGSNRKLIRIRNLGASSGSTMTDIKEFISRNRRSNLTKVSPRGN